MSSMRVTVAICAYTEQRWEMLLDAVLSAQHQSYQVAEIIVCIDHNVKLADRCRAYLDVWNVAGAPQVLIVENEYEGRLGSARNTILNYASGEVVAFLDDDARAAPDWLEFLVAPYDDKDVVAVGGAPFPVFDTERPWWFPSQFDWVFGCYYDGLPATLGPTKRLIGASMSARREALEKINGFHSDNHDDMDMCHRLAYQWPGDTIVLEPRAIVFHRVTKERVTWSYYWRRCFFVNKGKVRAFRDMGSAASLDADRAFVMGAIGRSCSAAIKGLVGGETGGVVRFSVLLAGVVFAVAGHVAGQLEARLSRRGPTI